MPYLTDDQIQKMVNRAVKKALRPRTTDQAAIDELTSNANDGSQTYSNRPGGFAAVMDTVRQRDRETVLRNAVRYVRNNPAKPINSLKESIVEIYGIGGADLNAVIAEGRKK